MYESQCECLLIKQQQILEKLIQAKKKNFRDFQYDTKVYEEAINIERRQKASAKLLRMMFEVSWTLINYIYLAFKA